MRVAVILDFLQPGLDVRECVSSTLTKQLPGDIVDEQGSDGASVVRPRDGPEILLPCSVPDLQLDGLVIDGERLGSKLNADGHIVRGPCLILNELQDDAGLADSGIADHDKFEEIVVRIHLAYKILCDVSSISSIYS